MLSNQTGANFCYLAGKYEKYELIGHLYSPGAHTGPYAFFPYALDNGAYGAYKNKTTWDRDGWIRHLRWAALSGQRPLWVLVPDVVANRDATLFYWEAFSPLVRDHGYRPAFAAQDGMSFEDVPDDDCVIFIGGEDEWKDEAIGPWCRRFPGRVHVGRVDEMNRLMRCYRAGAVSVDGTGWWHKKAKAQSAQYIQLLEYLAFAANEYDVHGRHKWEESLTSIRRIKLAP
jgi:hypothetical protein